MLHPGGGRRHHGGKRRQHGAVERDVARREVEAEFADACRVAVRRFAAAARRVVATQRARERRAHETAAAAAIAVVDGGGGGRWRRLVEDGVRRDDADVATEAFGRREDDSAEGAGRPLTAAVAGDDGQRDGVR